MFCVVPVSQRLRPSNPRHIVEGGGAGRCVFYTAGSMTLVRVCGGNKALEC